MSKKKQRLKQQQQQKKEIKITVKANIVPKENDGSLLLFKYGLLGTKNGPVQTCNARITKSYSRIGKADKIVAQYRLDNANCITKEIDTLLEEYDGVYVIDTNTPDYNKTGKNWSVCCFSFFYKERIYPTNFYQCGPIIYFTLKDESEPEKVAIKRLINLLELNVPYIIGRKFAIITDHDLNAHDNLNSQKKELLPGYDIPEYITLMYASSDTGSDVINKAIKKCDKEAKSILNEWISRGYIKESLYNIWELFEKPKALYGLRQRLLRSICIPYPV